jgi:hypothetical protein
MGKCEVVKLQTKLWSVLLELDMSEVLSEHIRGIVNPWDKEQFNLFKYHHSIAYKVVLDVDVFGVLFGN